ncbi:MAG: prepilin peptidase, partial [Streptomyces sp.]
MDPLVYLVVGGALWGALAGLLVPRAVYRLSVAPDEAWRSACPDGHPLGGWVGFARCPRGDRFGPSGPGVA